MDIKDLIYNDEEIQKKREEIARRIMVLSPNVRNRSIVEISPSDLMHLFQLYDEVFMQSQFATGFQGKMKFSLSKRLTRSAGKTICPKNIRRIRPADVMIEVRIGIDFFFNYDQVNSEKKVNGIVTHNALEALQLVFEHELCHVIEFINFYESNCRQKRFKVIAKNIFGHTQSYHQLPTRGQIVREKLGLNPGDTVWFIYKDRRVHGVLYRIHKRAVIMVRAANGRYMDREGHRYLKFYVPLEKLHLLNHGEK